MALTAEEQSLEKLHSEAMETSTTISDSPRIHCTCDFRQGGLKCNWRYFSTSSIKSVNVSKQRKHYVYRHILSHRKTSSKSNLRLIIRLPVPTSQQYGGLVTLLICPVSVENIHCWLGPKSHPRRWIRPSEPLFTSTHNGRGGPDTLMENFLVGCWNTFLPMNYEILLQMKYWPEFALKDRWKTTHSIKFTVTELHLCAKILVLGGRQCQLFIKGISCYIRGLFMKWSTSTGHFMANKKLWKMLLLC